MLWICSKCKNFHEELGRPESNRFQSVFIRHLWPAARPSGNNHPRSCRCAAVAGSESWSVLPGWSFSWHWTQSCCCCWRMRERCPERPRRRLLGHLPNQRVGYQKMNLMWERKHDYNNQTVISHDKVCSASVFNWINTCKHSCRSHLKTVTFAQHGLWWSWRRVASIVPGFNLLRHPLHCLLVLRKHNLFICRGADKLPSFTRGWRGKQTRRKRGFDEDKTKAL